MRAPPPKMRDLVAPELETPVNPYRNTGLGSSVIVRPVSPEDVYDDRSSYQSHNHSRSYTTNHYDPNRTMRENERFAQSGYPQAPPPRQISNNSSSTAVSGSENWETYDDNSELEPEPDASDAYYAKVRAAAARNKRFTPDEGYSSYHSHAAQASKRSKGIPPAMHAGHGVVDAEGNRIISGSEWTDEDAF